MSRARLLLSLAAVAAALAGCDVTSGDKEQPKRAPKEAKAPSDGRVIRAWSRALNAGRYGLAGDFFAPKALVDQGEPFRLPSSAAAVVFNRSLPCEGEVTAIEDEGRTTLASFRLRPGPGGPCEGRARVRFTIRDGKFTEFRQLSGAPLPQGDAA